jgi:hypothetical protein
MACENRLAPRPSSNTKSPISSPPPRPFSWGDSFSGGPALARLFSHLLFLFGLTTAHEPKVSSLAIFFLSILRIPCHTQKFMAYSS